MNYVIDCEEYSLEKKQLVLMAFNRLALRPILYGDSYSDVISVALESTYRIAHSYTTSLPKCSSFNQLMFDSGLPFKEDGIESYCILEPEALLSGDMVHKSIKNFTIRPYAITDEELKNLIKGV